MFFVFCCEEAAGAFFGGEGGAKCVSDKTFLFSLSAGRRRLFLAKCVFYFFVRCEQAAGASFWAKRFILLLVGRRLVFFSRKNVFENP